MCGRYVAATPSAALASHFDARVADEAALEPSYNVAPTDPVAAVACRPTGERRLGRFQWGLIPSWSNPSAGAGGKLTAARPPLINARAETVGSKSPFRAAFIRRRCLVPADAFYEWERVDGARRPWLIRAVDGAPLAFAGLWETLRPAGPEGPRLTTCAIVTTTANATLRSIHDRMPVIVPRDRWDAWLDPDETNPEALKSLMGPAPDDLLERYRVSSAVNHVARNDPTLIEAEPVGSPPAPDPGSPEGPVPLSLL